MWFESQPRDSCSTGWWFKYGDGTSNWIPSRPPIREIFVRAGAERRLAGDVDSHSMEGECNEEGSVGCSGDMRACGTGAG
jgi:hypothetical protein